MFSFRETYFRLVGLFDWGYARTQFLLSVSRNRYGFTLAGYQNEKSATNPALILGDLKLPIKELMTTVSLKGPYSHLKPSGLQTMRLGWLKVHLTMQ